MMKSIILACAVCAAATPAPAPTNLAGPWKFEFLRENRDELHPDAPAPAVCRMKQNGKKLHHEDTKTSKDHEDSDSLQKEFVSFVFLRAFVMGSIQRCYFSCAVVVVAGFLPLMYFLYHAR